MQPRPGRLDVYFGSDLVGAVHDSATLPFEHAPGWLGGDQRMSLAAIPLQAGRQATPEVQAFFENLLPEGELRDDLAAQRKASTLFPLLLEVAGDTAGAFVLVVPGQTPEAPRYEATNWDAISAILAKRSAAAIDIHEQGARISLAGAQDKTSIALFDDGVPRLPKGTSPSTHILKPNIRRLAKVWHSAANETIVMRAAALAGLPTAEVFYEAAHRSLRRAPLRPPAAPRRHAGPTGAVRPVPTGRHRVRPQVREGRRPGPGRLRRTDPPLQHAARRRPAPPAALGVLQPLRGQPRQPRQEPVDLQRARPGRDADAVLRPDVHAAVPGAVARVRPCDRRRGRGRAR